MSAPVRTTAVGAPPEVGWSARTPPRRARSATGPDLRTARSSRRGRFAVAFLGLLLVLAAGVAGAVVASSAVEVHVDGEVLTTRTFAADVGGILERLEVAIGDADRVVPPRDAPVEDGLVIAVHRARTVEVIVDRDPPLTVLTTFETVGDVLREVGFEELLAREARLEPAVDEPVGDAGRIVVRFPVTVTIAVDGEVVDLDTYVGTVGAALDAAGVVLGARDLVDPPREHALEGATAITVRRVAATEVVVEIPIPHGEQRRNTDDLPQGETLVETAGRDGLRREIHEVTTVDGEETGRELVAEEIVREPTDRIVLVGTAPAPLRDAQRLLAALGYPIGPIDGVDGAQTRRGLCAWRRLEGRDVDRGPLRAGELEALQATRGLPSAAPGRGVTVDRTCQVVFYRQDGRWQQVHAASTGAGGLPNVGSYTIQRTRAGWHTSTLYPAPEPNMYNTLYFHGAIAIHGSAHVPTYPASSGCVRVTPASADQLFAALGVGDPVRVIGTYG